MLCYFMMKRCPQNFWRIGIVRVVLSSRDSAIKGAIVRIKKTNAILERHVNKLFPIDKHDDANQGKRTKVKMRSSHNWQTKEKI